MLYPAVADHAIAFAIRPASSPAIGMATRERPGATYAARSVSREPDTLRPRRAAGALYSYGFASFLGFEGSISPTFRIW